MFRSLFEGHALLDLPIVTMLFFFAVFVAVLVLVLMRNGASFEEVARLPLDAPETLRAPGDARSEEA